MNYIHHIKKLYPFLVGLVVFQLGFLTLAEGISPLHTVNSTSSILQQSPASPLHHHPSHPLGFFELEEANNRLEKSEFLKEGYLSEAISVGFSSPLFVLFVEEQIQSLPTHPIYLLDEQFRL